ncbi:hypothetical protein ElyMa_004570900 [Elysia marginata]|uniref:Uncharacterized protein n=1 Tax=Elysia marginata TaxID=1093978 RepID=A0AAV4HSB1_9GAST|nr:hypothetical protein ElyMa_004570900 [Elysia marginata]
MKASESGCRTEAKSPPAWPAYLLHHDPIERLLPHQLSLESPLSQSASSYPAAQRETSSSPAARPHRDQQDTPKTLAEPLHFRRTQQWLLNSSLSIVSTLASPACYHRHSD